MTVDELLSLNPFPGLRAFAPNEADRFFGRSQQIADLVARLAEVSFLAVTGASGCGKSSLVCAGLLSALARRPAAEAVPEWRCAIMRPGNQPIANLAEALASLLGQGSGSEESDEGEIYGRLQLGGLGLVEAVRLARLGPQTRILMVVDQFEEIFRFKRMIDADEASAFVKLLLNATRDPDSPVRVIITLRSDALGSCADFRDLPERINRGQYLVPKLTREQRKETIIKPVELRGYGVAPRLVQRLLNDVPDDFDDLPVMQHALTRTWNRWAQTCQGSRQIDLEDYEAVGSSKQALSNHADEAFDSLPGLGRTVEKVFRALTERIAEGIEIRRPLPFDLLCQVVGGDRGQVAQVVERFRRPDTSFLLPSKAIALADNPVIDISHESLIRQWKRLREWASAEAESRKMLLHLVEDARAHLAQQGSLWRGRELERAQDWRRCAQPTIAWIGLCTNTDGKAAWQSVEGFLARSAEETRKEKWRAKFQAGGVVALGLAILAAVLAWHSLKQAKFQDLASNALQSLDQNPARSAHFALAAVALDPRNARADSILRQSLAALEVAHTEWVQDLGAPVADIRYSRDGTRLVTASGTTVTIFDPRDPMRGRASESRAATISKAWLIADNRVLVTQTFDDQTLGQVQIQRLGDSRVTPLACVGEQNWPYTVSVSPDERSVALGCYNGDVQVFDPTEPSAGAKATFAHQGSAEVTITALGISADGEYLASGDADGAVKIWKIGVEGAWIALDAVGAEDPPVDHGCAVRDIGFHPEDPSLLVTAGDDNRAIVWRLDLEGRRLDPVQENPWPLKHERPVTAARFASGPLRQTVYTISDKRVRFWENAKPDWRQIRRHDDWVLDANLSARGDLLVTASGDGTARLWSTQSATPVAVLRGHRGDVVRAILNPAGDRVVTASTDGTVRLWHFRAPSLLLSSKKWALSAAFDPDGTRVIISEEGKVRLLALTELSADAVPSSEALPATDLGDQVSSLSWSRDGKFIVGNSCRYGLNPACRPLLWDAQSRQEITPNWIEGESCAVFGPGTNELLTLGKEGRIAIWDAGRLTEAHPRPLVELGEKSRGWLVALSPDGEWIAALVDHRVELWQRDDPQAAPRELEGHQGNVMSLQFSPDNRWLLTSSKDRTARIWPVDGTSEPKVLNGHTLALYAAAFDPSGVRVVTGSADSTIRIWDAGSGGELATLSWHREGVNDVRFSPDGRSILSASDDGTVKLGAYDTLAMTSAELRQQVDDLAKLPEGELKKIKDETDGWKRYLGFPARLFRER
jgi:WD40 repeat protein